MSKGPKGAFRSIDSVVEAPHSSPIHHTEDRCRKPMDVSLQQTGPMGSALSTKTGSIGLR